MTDLESRQKYAVEILDITEEMLKKLRSDDDTNSKMIFMDARLKMRQHLMEELDQLVDLEKGTDYLNVMKKLRSIDDQVNAEFSKLKGSVVNQAKGLQQRRIEINRASRVNKKYIGVSHQPEGYFIDNKK